MDLIEKKKPYVFEHLLYSTSAFSFSAECCDFVIAYPTALKAVQVGDIIGIPD